jgi:glycine cleavage system aminomethyltransferase T
VTGLEALWLGATSTNDLNIELLHHKADGWTYGAGGTPTTPTPIADMSSIHSTEVKSVSNEHGAFKVSNLDQFVHGDKHEGVLVRVTTAGANQLGNGQVAMSFTG